MYYEYKECWIELLVSPHEDSQWDAHVYFPDGDSEQVGRDYSNIAQAHSAAIAFLELNRLLHLSEEPNYFF